MIGITKSSEPFVRPSGVLIFTLRYFNTGGSTATGIVVTETVPASTTFFAGGGTFGWSCPNGSPAGTLCTLGVPDLPPGGRRTLLFAVDVDAHPQSRTISNTVLINDAEGGSSGGGSSTTIGEPAPAPALLPWAVVAALASLIAIARRRW